jgi:hypothetical protein
MKTTQKQLIESSNIDASLIRAVVRQLGGWDEFTEHAQDVCNHGMTGGFVGFTYYTDTVAFAKRNKAAILDLCKQMSDDFGQSGTIEFIASFNCLKGTSQEEVADGLYNPKSDDRTTIYNALAWFAGEEVCRAYDDMVQS